MQAAFVDLAALHGDAVQPAKLFARFGFASEVPLDESRVGFQLRNACADGLRRQLGRQKIARADLAHGASPCVRSKSRATAMVCCFACSIAASSIGLCAATAATAAA